MKDRRLIYLVVSCVLYLALWAIVPQIKAFKHPLALLLLTVLFMFAQVSVARWLVSLKARPLRAAVVLLVSVFLWLGVVKVATAPYIPYFAKGYGPVIKKMGKDLPLGSVPPRTVEAKFAIVSKQIKGNARPAKVRTVTVMAERIPASMPFRLMIYDRVAGKSRALTSLLMILVASSFGYLLSFMLRHPHIILPVAAFSACVDIWTVRVGPTLWAIQKMPSVVQSVAVAMPAPGSAVSGGAAAPMSYIGPADFIFFAMLLGAVYRLKMEPGRTFWITFPLMSVGMVLVILSGVVPVLGRVLNVGLPALVLIGGSVIVANWRHFKLKREEWAAMGIVAVVLGAVLAAFTYAAGMKR